MHSLFPAWPLMAAFFLASLALAVTPGPGVIYVVTRTLAQGRRAGVASVAGVALGNLGNAIGAAIGLAALFAVSSIAFTVVKYTGAAYLIYLGIKTLRAPVTPVAAAEDAAQAIGQEEKFDTTNIRRIFRDGFLVALLNPKTTIFFAAFLPQFMDPAAPAVLQSISLGAVFVLIAATTDCVYVSVASAVAPMLNRMRGAGAIGRYVTASTFIGLGIFTAFAGGRSAK
ncbi:LysE family translocator [Noviherbaspirillum sp. Root189]|uniref:LysE family translocator n=1 Tax=Noviherbaspirillum sp. Root189 TaxID=1736487 RepID=UPI00070D6620|nr:LysE family translocator [Noviherbaspirillum sp. Root189]KRB89030.1 threonine transporter [Noviherbaspirillum sp. Root189]